MTYYSGAAAILFAALILCGCEREDSAHSGFLSKHETICIKGICAVEVVLCHIYAYYHAGIAMKLFNKAAYIPVAMFFLISGYGLVLSADSKRNYISVFLKNRLSKLYIPLWISLVLNAMLRLMLGAKREYAVSAIVKDIVGLNAIWFFVVIVIYYLCFYFVWKITKGKNSVAILSILTVLQCVGCCAMNMNKAYYTSSFGFVLGMLLARDKENNWQKIEKIIHEIQTNRILDLIIFVVAAVSCIIYLRYSNTVFVGQLLFRNMLGVLIVCIIMALLYYFRAGNRISEMLGKYSYEIFLIHPTVIICVKSGYLKNFASWCQIIVILALTFIASIVLHKISGYVTKGEQGK